MKFFTQVFGACVLGHAWAYILISGELHLLNVRSAFHILYFSDYMLGCICYSSHWKHYFDNFMEKETSFVRGLIRSVIQRTVSLVSLQTVFILFKGIGKPNPNGLESRSFSWQNEQLRSKWKIRAASHFFARKEFLFIKVSKSYVHF